MSTLIKKSLINFSIDLSIYVSPTYNASKEYFKDILNDIKHDFINICNKNIKSMKKIVWTK